MKFLNKKNKNLDVLDMAFVKLAVMFFIMFLFSTCSIFRDFVQHTNPAVFFVAWIIFAIRPLLRFFK